MVEQKTNVSQTNQENKIKSTTENSAVSNGTYQKTTPIIKPIPINNPTYNNQTATINKQPISVPRQNPTNASINNINNVKQNVDTDKPNYLGTNINTAKPSTNIPQSNLNQNKNIKPNSTNSKPILAKPTDNLANLAIKKSKKEKKKDRRWLIILLLLLLIALIVGAVILITQITKPAPEHLFQDVDIELLEFDMQKLEVTEELVIPGDEFTISAKIKNSFDPVYVRFSLIMMGISKTGLPLTVTEVSFDELYYTDGNTKTYLLKGDEMSIGNRSVTYFYGLMNGGTINQMNEQLIPYVVDLEGDFKLNGEYFNNEWQGATLSIKFVIEAIEQYQGIDLTASRSKVVDSFEEIFSNFEAQNT